MRRPSPVGLIVMIGVLLAGTAVTMVLGTTGGAGGFAPGKVPGDFLLMRVFSPVLPVRTTSSSLVSLKFLEKNSHRLDKPEASG